MNFAKRSVQNEQSGAAGNQGNSSQLIFPKWKTTNTGPTINRNNKAYNWCKWHKRYVLSHNSNTCRENLSHPNHAEHQKKKAEWTSKAKPELEINFME